MQFSESDTETTSNDDYSNKKGFYVFETDNPTTGIYKVHENKFTDSFMKYLNNIDKNPYIAFVNLPSLVVRAFIP